MLEFSSLRLPNFLNGIFILCNEVIMATYTIFAPVQKVNIALPLKKIQGFFETLKIIRFQNYW